jgi:hypothetical protein
LSAFFFYSLKVNWCAFNCLCVSENRRCHWMGLVNVWIKSVVDLEMFLVDFLGFF